MIIDNRPKPKTVYVHTLVKGDKFMWNENLFIVNGSIGNSIKVVHLITGDTHTIDPDNKVELVDVIIAIEAAK